MKRIASCQYDSEQQVNISFGSCVKGALSRYSVFYDFLRSKMAARRLEAAAPVKEKQAFAALFFSSPVPSFAIDRRWSISQLPLKSHSESSLGRSWALR